MNYGIHIKRTLVSIFNFAAIAIWLLYLYFKLWDFAKAAVSLKYVNIQTVSFILYSFLLGLFPIARIYRSDHCKKKLFMWIFFSLSFILLVGAISDLITYNFFKGYSFVEGDAIFCNIVICIPNIYGTLCCLLLAALYAFLGIYITNRRFTSCLYLFVFLIGVIPPFIYSSSISGGLPRQTWLEKAAFIIPFQACLLISLIISSSLRRICIEYACD